MKKILLIVVPLVLLVALGGAYSLGVTKPAKAQPKPKVDGSVYVLGKEFLINLQGGHYAKLTAALVLAHNDVSTGAAAGDALETVAEPPEGFGTMRQEALVRAVITDALTGASQSELVDEGDRTGFEEAIVARLLRKTDVKVKEVLFTDVTVQ